MFHTNKNNLFVNQSIASSMPLIPTKLKKTQNWSFHSSKSILNFYFAAHNFQLEIISLNT